MTDAECYLTRALELEQIARESFRPELRQELLKLADDWRQMAEQAAAMEDRAFADPAIPRTVRRARH
jgi:hypothetical protein